MKVYATGANCVGSEVPALAVAARTTNFAAAVTEPAVPIAHLECEDHGLIDCAWQALPCDFDSLHDYFNGNPGRVVISGGCFPDFEVLGIIEVRVLAAGHLSVNVDEGFRKLEASTRARCRYCTR